MQAMLRPSSRSRQKRRAARGSRPRMPKRRPLGSCPIAPVRSPLSRHPRWNIGRRTGNHRALPARGPTKPAARRVIKASRHGLANAVEGQHCLFSDSPCTEKPSRHGDIRSVLLRVARAWRVRSAGEGRTRQRACPACPSCHKQDFLSCHTQEYVTLQDPSRYSTCLNFLTLKHCTQLTRSHRNASHIVSLSCLNPY